MRILIVPDKFKGTLTAHDAARAIARGWSKARPGDSLEFLPMSDGGDGFGPVFGALLDARARSLSAIDAAHRPCRARWWWSPSRKTAVIETAQSNGLALLPKGEFHPYDLDTTGVARLIRAAVEAGASSCLLGVGGSATNDGGFGMARALGWRFLDARGRELQRWTELDRLARVTPGEPLHDRCQFVVATDVSNPLCGPKGASAIYGPQKGLLARQVPVADRKLARLAEVVKKQLGFDSRAPGSGAAGGLGYGLQAFLKAKRQLGFDLFAELSELAKRMEAADLVIAAEGSVDAQTRMGKGVGQLIAAAREAGKPVLLLAGRMDPRARRLPGVLAAGALLDITDEQTALASPAPHLARLAQALARESFPPTVEAPSSKARSGARKDSVARAAGLTKPPARGSRT